MKGHRAFGRAAQFAAALQVAMTLDFVQQRAALAALGDYRSRGKGRGAPGGLQHLGTWKTRLGADRELITSRRLMDRSRYTPRDCFAKGNR